jgi:hypothetical protein
METSRSYKPKVVLVRTGARTLIHFVAGVIASMAHWPLAQYRLRGHVPCTPPVVPQIQARPCIALLQDPQVSWRLEDARRRRRRRTSFQAHRAACT